MPTTSPLKFGIENKRLPSCKETGELKIGAVRFGYFEFNGSSFFTNIARIRYLFQPITRLINTNKSNVLRWSF